MKPCKDNDAMPEATFEYDALGRRIETVDAIAGTTTRYYYDEQRVVLRTQISFSSRTIITATNVKLNY
jgi:YD repeat-containing protein